MMEIHSSQILALALTPSGLNGPAQVSPPAPVEHSEAVRFRALMQGDGDGVTSVGEGRMDVGQPLAPTTPPANLGEAILRNIEDVRGNFREVWDSVTALGGADRGPVSPQELFQFQLKLIESSFQYEMVGKVVSKAEQNVEQIVKMQ